MESKWEAYPRPDQHQCAAYMQQFSQISEGNTLSWRQGIVGQNEGFPGVPLAHEGTKNCRFSKAKSRQDRENGGLGELPKDARIARDRLLRFTPGFLRSEGTEQRIISMSQRPQSELWMSRYGSMLWPEAVAADLLPIKAGGG